MGGGGGPPDRPASGSRLDYVPRPPPLGPWAFDIVCPDAVALPAFRLVSRHRAGLAPPLSACLPGSFPLWESSVERRPWHTRPLARHTSDRESADALPRRLVVERGRIQRARGGMWRKNASSSRLGAPRMSSLAVPGSSIRVEPRRRLIRGRGGGRSTRKFGPRATCVVDRREVGSLQIMLCFVFSCALSVLPCCAVFRSTSAPVFSAPS